MQVGNELRPVPVLGSVGRETRADAPVYASPADSVELSGPVRPGAPPSSSLATAGAFTAATAAGGQPGPTMAAIGAVEGRRCALGPRFSDAVRCAQEWHAGQTRKGSDIPYVTHLLATASIALQFGADEDEAIGALLHDVVEDTDVGRKQIAERFGERVEAIVDGCTDANVRPKPPWRERKERYIAHVRTASSSVCLVSASDKLANVRDMLVDYRSCGESLWERFKAGREGTIWYYRELVAAYGEAGHHPALVAELERAVEELDRISRT